MTIFASGVSITRGHINSDGTAASPSSVCANVGTVKQKKTANMIDHSLSVFFMVESLSKSVDEALIPCNQMVIQAPDSESESGRVDIFPILYGFQNLIVFHLHGSADRLEQGPLVTGIGRYVSNPPWLPAAGR